MTQQLDMRQVVGTFYTYLEVRECRPRLRRLQRLLSADPYRGRLHPGVGYSRARLADAVQASGAQLDTALRDCHALLMDGRRATWRHGGGGERDTPSTIQGVRTCLSGKVRTPVWEGTDTSSSKCADKLSRENAAMLLRHGN